MSLIVECVFVAWLVSSVVVQCSARVRSWLSSRDHLPLFPSWRLFAPNPQQQNYRLECRFVRRDGTAGPWQPVLVTQRPSTAWLWHPQFLLTRIRNNLGSRMAARAGLDERRRLATVPLFRGLEWHLAHRVSPGSAEALQYRVSSFRLAETGASGSVELFESDVYQPTE